MKNKPEEIRLYITGVDKLHRFSCNEINKIKKANRQELLLARKDDAISMILSFFSIMSTTLLWAISLLALVLSVTILTSYRDDKLNEILSQWNSDDIWQSATVIFVMMFLTIFCIRVLKRVDFDIDAEIPLSNYQRTLFIKLYKSLGIEFHKEVRRTVSTYLANAESNPFVEYYAHFESNKTSFLTFPDFFPVYKVPMKQIDKWMIREGINDHLLRLNKGVKNV